MQVLQGAFGDGASDPEQSRLMGIVVREVERLNGLIGDFLRYSRPAPIQPEDVDVSALVSEIAEISELECGSELEIVLDLDAEVVVSADPSLLKAVVWNLWNNAREAMDGSGRLLARVRRIPGDPVFAPVDLSDLDPAAITDPLLLSRLTEDLRAEIQALVDTGLHSRESVWA